MALADNALTTVAAVEVVVGTGLYTSARIEQLINIVSGVAERLCHRSFGKASGIEGYQGTDRTLLVLDRRPILDVASVKIDGVEVEDYSRDSQRDRQGMLYRVNRWPMRAPLMGLPQTPNTNQRGFNVEVEYTAGYVLPKDEDAEADPPVVRTLPYEFEGAVIDEVVDRLKGDAVNQALKSERTPGGYSYETRDQAGDDRLLRRLVSLGFVRPVI